MAAPRAIITRWGAGYSTKYKKWREAVALEARAGMKGRQPYPKGRRLEMILLLPKKRSNSDLSNHAKAWEDALQGIAYENDSQIDRLVVEVAAKWPLAWMDAPRNAVAYVRVQEIAYA